MKPQLHLHIPTPCHEDWNKMTDVARGKFCSSCSKEVIDFSLMTDVEVLNYFKKATGNTCGRFDNTQLQRALQETKIENKKGWKWLLASITSLVMFSKSNAQKISTLTKGKPTVVKTELQKPVTIVGDTIIIPHLETKKGETVVINKKITGTVVDEKNKPVAFASIVINHSNKGTTTDKDGHFNLSAINTLQKNTLTISFIGYKTKEVIVTKQQINTPIQIQLTEMETQLMGDVVIVSSGRKIKFTGRVVDEKNKPVVAASVYTNNNHFVTTTKDDGSFDFTASTTKDSLPILFESMGFEIEKTTVALEDDEIDLQVTMKTKMEKLPEVVVVAYPTISCYSVTAGATIAYTKITKVDTLKAIVNKILDNQFFTIVESPFKIYPNPAPKNSTINILIKEAGNYQIQLFDNASKLLKVEEAITSTKQQNIQFQLPYVAAGNYYIRLVNNVTKKVYTDKIVVQ